jgi:hypothetical protein
MAARTFILPMVKHEQWRYDEIKYLVEALIGGFSCGKT